MRLMLKSAMPKLARPLGFGAALATVAALVIAAGYFMPLGEWLRAFSAWADAAGWVGLLLFGLTYVLATLLLAPAFPMTLALAFMYGWWAALISFIAGLVAAVAAFLITRYSARSSAKRFLNKYPSLKALDSIAADEGFGTVALLRLSPVAPFAASNYAFGMTAVDLRAYILGTGAGIIPGTILNVYVGVLGKAASGNGADTATWIGLGLGLIATICLTVWMGKLAKARMERKKPAKRPR